MSALRHFGRAWSFSDVWWFTFCQAWLDVGAHAAVGAGAAWSDVFAYVERERLGVYLLEDRLP